jgi:hypothetical protein
MGLVRSALQVLAVAVALIAAPWLLPAAQAHGAMAGHVHVGHVHVAPGHAATAPAAPEASAPVAAAGQVAAHELRIATSESPADPIDTGGCAVGCCGPGVSCCGAALAILAPSGGMPPPLRALMLGFALPSAVAGVDPEALRKPPRSLV